MPKFCVYPVFSSSTEFLKKELARAGVGKLRPAKASNKQFKKSLISFLSSTKFLVIAFRFLDTKIKKFEADLK